MQALAIDIPLICILLGGILLFKWPAKRERTFSEYVADNKTLTILFMTVFPFLTAAYYIFLAAWLGPHMAMPEIYYWLLWAAFISQLLLTWIPAKKGKFLVWHFTFALVVTIVMILIAAIVLAMALGAQNITHIILSFVYLVLNSLIFISYFIRRRIGFVKRNLLALEICFFLFFWVYVAMLSYL